MSRKPDTGYTPPRPTLWDTLRVLRPLVVGTALGVALLALIDWVH